MTTDTLCEIIDAAHLTKYCASAFDQRGGLCVVAPPGSLKNAVMDYVLDYYPNSFVLADANMYQLDRLRENMLSGRYSTMAFPEFAKIYARDARTASNVEMTIQQMIDEGWQGPSTRDPRAGALKARMLVIVGLTPTFYESQFSRWQKSGFMRRWIVSLFNVENAELITNAIKENRKLGLSTIPRKAVTATGIPFEVSKQEGNFLHSFLREQPDDKTPLIFFMRIYAVLKWKHGIVKAKQLIYDFSPTLKRDGGILVLADK